jgi:hypothetical protein
MRLKILTERSSVSLWYDDQNAAAPVGLVLSSLDRERWLSLLMRSSAR